MFCNFAAMQERGTCKREGANINKEKKNFLLCNGPHHVKQNLLLNNQKLLTAILCFDSYHNVGGQPTTHGMVINTCTIKIQATTLVLKIMHYQLYTKQLQNNMISICYKSMMVTSQLKLLKVDRGFNFIVIYDGFEIIKLKSSR